RKSGMKKKFSYLFTAMAFASVDVDPGFAQADRPPYKSPVPFDRFSTTLAEQQGKHENNELTKRFQASRKKQANDPYRPFYHFVSPESTLNDPNGLSYGQGNWHLFYQAYPPEDPR